MYSPSQGEIGPKDADSEKILFTFFPPTVWMETVQILCRLPLLGGELFSCLTLSHRVYSS